MTPLVALHNAVFARLEKADWLLPVIARFLFAAIFLGYFWVSGMTKLGDGMFGLFSPAMGAYAQIFPRTMEAVGYEVSQLTIFHTLVVLAGTWAEFLLPILILLGLLTRLAALGMIGFVVVQTLTDIFGHGLLEETGAIGGWFDKAPDSLIMDQRALWIFLLLVLVVKGAGKLSVDQILARRVADQSPSAARVSAVQPR